MARGKLNFYYAFFVRSRGTIVLNQDNAEHKSIMNKESGIITLISRLSARAFVKGNFLSKYVFKYPSAIKTRLQETTSSFFIYNNKYNYLQLFFTF